MNRYDWRLPIANTQNSPKVQVEMCFVFYNFKNDPRFIISRLSTDDKTLPEATEHFLLGLDDENLRLWPVVSGNFKSRLTAPSAA